MSVRPDVLRCADQHEKSRPSSFDRLIFMIILEGFLRNHDKIHVENLCLKTFRWEVKFSFYRLQGLRLEDECSLKAFGIVVTSLLVATVALVLQFHDLLWELTPQIYVVTYGPILIQILQRGVHCVYITVMTFFPNAAAWSLIKCTTPLTLSVPRRA